jgi:hypothetical protein
MEYLTVFTFLGIALTLRFFINLCHDKFIANKLNINDVTQRISKESLILNLDEDMRSILSRYGFRFENVHGRFRNMKMIRMVYSPPDWTFRVKFNIELYHEYKYIFRNRNNSFFYVYAIKLI